MFIEPNSKIKIIKNVPLDTTYQHTILFSDAGAQSSYFSSMAKYNLDAQSYQRVNRGAMRIGISADNIYDCNYLMFQNTSYGTKWFYAFITSVEYVNNETCEVVYQIDDMQTYMFDVELLQSFVEREHSSTDVAGDNIVDEPFNTGDIICNNIESVDDMQEYVVMLWHAGLNTSDEVGGVYNNMFCGLDVEPLILSDGGTSANAIKTMLAQFTDNNRTDAIVSLTAMPRKFFNAIPTPVQYLQYITKPTTIGRGYTPRNKKLLTYPYNYLIVDCGNDSGVYRYEWFNNNINTVWRLVGACSPNPQIACIPVNYNSNFSDSGVVNITEELVMDGFPQLAYNVDGYRAYLAQTSIGSALKGTENAFDASSTSNMSNEVIPTGYDRFTGKAQPMQNSLGRRIENWALNNIGNMLTGNTGNIKYDAFRKTINSAKHPNMAKGNQVNTVDTNMRAKNFYFKQMCVSQNYARIIDNYFDMFGYATQLVKVPNRSVRPHWNYVKTNGCIVRGNAPADAVRNICQIYDNGITFWKNPSEVGNYSLNNSL